MSAHTGAAALLALLKATPAGDSVGAHHARVAIDAARSWSRDALATLLETHAGRVAPVARALGVSHLAVRALAAELGVEITNKPGRRQRSWTYGSCRGCACTWRWEGEADAPTCPTCGDALEPGEKYTPFRTARNTDRGLRHTRGGSQPVRTRGRRETPP